MTQRGTFVLDIHPDRVDEYVEAHAAVWPEMLDALKNAGFRNYTIFRHGTQMFGYFEADDVAAAEREIMRQDVSARWAEAGRHMLAEAPSPDQPLEFPAGLPEVFRLD